MRAYYEAHREQGIARAARFRHDQMTPERRVSYQNAQREWRRAHPEHVAAANARRRRLARQQPGFTSSEWRAILDLYGWRCLCCGATQRLSPDHVVPLSEGGLNAAANLQPLCGPCNRRKGTRTIDYRMRHG